MLLDMHGTQYGLSQHNKILQDVDWFCSSLMPISCNVKKIHAKKL